MKIRIEYLFIVALLLCSCNRKKVENFFDAEKIISGRTLLADCLIGQPMEIVCIDSFILFYDRYEGQTITVIDAKNSRFVRRFLKEGQGPGEATGPLKLSVSDGKKLNIFQMQNGHLYEYDINDIINREHPPFREYIFSDRPANIKRIRDGFVGIGMFEKERYRLYDETGQTVNGVGKYPFRGENMDTQARFFLYQGNLCSSPDGTYFVMGTSYCDNLEFYRIDGNNALPVQKYETRDVEGRFEQKIVLDDNCVMAYKGSAGTGRYCYMLYSGTAYGERHIRTTGGKKIIIFEWDGTYVRTLETDKTVFSFCVDETDSTIFALTYEEETGFNVTHYNL